MCPRDLSKEVLKLKDENQSLRWAVEELTILNEISVAINSTLSLSHILNLIVKKCLRHLKVEQCAVMLLDEQKEKKPFKTIVRLGDTLSKILPYRLDTQLSGWMLKNRKPLLINDFQQDIRFKKGGKETFPIHSLICVPLITKGRMIGLLTVFNKILGKVFTPDDQRMLSIIATQSAQVIENARLLEEEQALIRMQEELRLAYNIQIKLLPKKAPSINDYDIMGKSIPAKEVGGDYFDFIHMDTNRLAFCLGDVSGKGIPAALLMSNLQATIRCQTIQNASTRDCLRISNTLMFQNTDPEKFASLFYGILNTQSHWLSFSNAGHNYPILFSEKKDPVQLKTGGIALGCLETSDFFEEKIQLAPGDLLLVYSDGITEAINDKEEEFGESRLVEIINKNKRNSSNKLFEKIITAVQSHSGDLPQMDDMTMVIIKREK